VIVVLFWTNDDMAGQPAAPRGDGQYLPILDRGDGHMLYLMARSTALDLDWNFDDDLRRFGDPWMQPIGPTGRKQIPHPIGPALIWTPLIWVAEAGAALANLFGADIPLHGYTPWHQRFVFLSSVFAGCAAGLLGRRLARQTLGARWAASYATAAVLLGTSITYYATIMPSYGHALDAIACGSFLAMWASTIDQWRLRRWVALGALLGLAALIRIQNFALGAVVAIEIGGVIVGDLRRRAADWRVRAIGWVGGGAITLAVAVVVFVPQLVYWHVVYGHWFAMPQGDKYTRFGSPMVLELLYAPRNGWFSSTPVAYLAMIGVFCLPRRARLIAVGLAAAVAIEVYLNSTILDWWGMASFGQRRLCSVTFVLVVGLAALLWRAGRLVARWPRIPRVVWHALALAVLAPMVAWNLWRVRELRGGRSAPTDVEPTCCDRVPIVVRDTFAAIYGRIGNPFEFPANLMFALRHDVEIQRWDIAVGYYALVPPPSTLVDDTLWYQRGGWRIGYPRAEPYLVGGWTESYPGERPYRWTTTRVATVLVPNLMPYSQNLTLYLAPGASRDVVVRWDHEVVARTTLHSGWNPVGFYVKDMAVGEHELSIESVLAPLAPTRAWDAPRAPVGVAVNTLELELERE
jgi:hypothetical protein